LWLHPRTCSAQSYTQRGFLESRGTLYPQKAPNDSAQAVGESLFRYEGFYAPSKTLEVAGAMDFRIDTHRQVERTFHLSWSDRETRRPIGEIRRLSATYHNGPLTFELGKQFIRWGKTDIVTPTGRFPPRDFLTVVDNDFVAVTAARLNYEKGSNTIEAVWSPRLTPSRIPLPDQRWAPPVDSQEKVDVQSSIPGGSQAGLRWNHAGAVEYEVAFYRGFNHLPSFDFLIPGPVFITNPGNPPFMTTVPSRTNPAVIQFYPKMLMAGGDIAVPFRLFTLKGEAAYFKSSDNDADDFASYVIQLERQSGEWSFVGGYGGEAITKQRNGTVTFAPGGGDITEKSDFAPDRGLTKTFLGRAGYTIDSNRSVALETAVRQNGVGAWVKGEYSEAFGQHWRATLNLTLIRGDMSDFLGQYRRNSHALLIVRYSF
jgi:hypothetical protein